MTDDIHQQLSSCRSQFEGLAQEQQEGVLRQLWETYGLVNEWIRTADQKISVLLAVDTLMAGALVGLLSAQPEPVQDTLRGVLTSPTVFVCLLGLASLMGSVALALLGVMPSLNASRLLGARNRASSPRRSPSNPPTGPPHATSSNSNQPQTVPSSAPSSPSPPTPASAPPSHAVPRSTIFFGHIADFPAHDKFARAVITSETEPSTRFLDLLLQVRVNAKIATQKHRAVQQAGCALLASLVLTAIALLLGFFLQPTRINSGGPTSSALVLYTISGPAARKSKA